MVLLSKPKILPEVLRITYRRFRGEISAEQHERMIDALLAPQPELPLGIGAVTEYKEGRK